MSKPKPAKKAKPSRKRYVAKRRMAKKGLNATSLIGFIKGGSLQFPFPPMLRVKLRTNITVNNTRAAGAINGNPADQFFKLNSPMNVGPALNYPLGTLGSFSSNVPAGLIYLLSRNAIDGVSPGIYQKFLVTHSSIRVNICTQGTTNRVTQITLLPVSQGSSSNTITSTHLAEQPLAKTILLPAGMTGFKVMKHSISVAKLGGITQLSTADDAYVGGSIAMATAIVDPDDLYVWQLRSSNLDTGLVEYSIMYSVDVIHDVIFFDRNYASSNVPA